MKYNVSATASTIVVISGPAIIAGSNLIFFAIMGNTPPTTFANTTIKNKVKQTVIETNKSVLSIKYILKKLTEDKINPTMQLTRSSFHKTLRISLVLMSPNAKPLIIKVEDWEPAFPPVSINIGINDARTITDCKALSNLFIMFPVNAADIINNRSHGNLCFANANALVFRYAFSDGCIAAIF